MGIDRLENIEIKEYFGRWYEIDRMEHETRGTLYLMEHEEFGDEAPCVIIDGDYNAILDDVYNGFLDIEEAEGE